MKKLLVFVFLLALFLIPAHPVAATYGDVSPQSITSFSETLPDDTLFYPDPITLSTISSPIFDGELDLETGPPLDYAAGYDTLVSACQGADNDNDGTILNDPAVTNTFGNLRVLIDLTIANYYKAGSFIRLNVTAYSIDGWLGSSSMFYSAAITGNGAITIDELVGQNTVQSVAFDIYYGTAVTTDHINVTLDSMTFYVATLSDNGYVEGFEDVSDWTTSSTSISSDGDVATITENGAGTTGKAYASMSSTDFFEYYYEFRVYTMTATAAALEFYSGSSYYTLRNFTAAGTYKGLISQSQAATMQRIGFWVGSNSGNIKPDYLRISLANESGWQHDGSTTVGFSDDSNNGWSFDYSSDGNIATLNFSRSGGSSGYGSIWLDFDTTTTESDLETSYYPFMSINWSCPEKTASNVRALWYVDGKSQGTTSEYIGGQAFYSTFDYREDLQNLAALTGSAGSNIGIRFLCYGSAGQYATIKIDYVKAYSIANWTYTGSGVSTDDYLYVSSNVLYSSDSSYTSMVLDHDPSLSVVYPDYSKWNVTTSLGTPQFDHYVSAWQGYSASTSGSLAIGTTTDIRIKFTASANLAAISFSNTQAWQEVNTLPIYFVVPISAATLWALNGWYMVLGAGMVVFSTCFAAIKIKSREGGTDDILLFLVLFIFGWALIIGSVI